MAEQMAGMTEQDMLNRPALELFPRTADVWQHARRVVETGEPYQIELRYRLTNQTKESWYDLLLQKHGDGLAASFTDISHLKEQTIFVEQMLNGSINGMIAYEAMRDETGHIYDLRIRLANEAAARIIGLPLDELLHNTMVKQYPSAHSSGLFARYRHTIESGESQRFESQYIYDGLNGWFDISVSKLGDGMLMTFVDISATKQYEQELRKSIENLQQSNQNLERFAYVASHDLQEPLRKVLSFGDMLRNQADATLSREHIDLINRMQSASRRMNALIQNLLAFSRLSFDQQPFGLVNLQELVDEVLVDLESVIQDKKAVIDVTSLPIVVGDALQLRQVFQNLLSNALKFVKAGTHPAIRIDCEQVPGHTIRPLLGLPVAKTDLNRPFYAIGIVDNGIGFDEKYVDQIFALFQRLNTRSEYQGTGIGLSIVQKVIENHSGYITARSQPGQGATFTIFLPGSEALVR